MVAAPVIPGRQRRRPIWCSGIFGRGPTRLISPVRTLNTCGNSSSFQRRRNGPTGVKRWFSVVVTQLCAPFSQCAIVRNFKIVKVRRRRPIRVCRKRTGPGEVNRIARPTTRKIGRRKGIARRTQLTSKSRFKRDCDHELGRSSLRLK